jgi:hypothetical protein
MLKKLLAIMIASAFAFTAFAQAPKSDTTASTPSASHAKKDQAKAAKNAKGQKKAAKGKGKAKSDEAKK